MNQLPFSIGHFTKASLAAIFIVLLIGTVLFDIRKSPPSIAFTGVRQTQSGPVAIFLMTNASSSAYSYVSTRGSTAPLNYVVRADLGSEWKMLGRVSRGVAELRTLTPHSYVEFTVEKPRGAPGRFQVGIEFQRGTAEDVQRRWNHEVPDAVGHEPNYTWSQPTR